MLRVAAIAATNALASAGCGDATNVALVLVDIQTAADVSPFDQLQLASDRPNVAPWFVPVADGQRAFNAGYYMRAAGPVQITATASHGAGCVVASGSVSATAILGQSSRPTTPLLLTAETPLHCFVTLPDADGSPIDADGSAQDADAEVDDWARPDGGEGPAPPSCLAGTRECGAGNTYRVCSAAGDWSGYTSCALPSPACSNGQCAYHLGTDRDDGTTETLYANFTYALRIDVTARARVFRLGMFGTATGRSLRLALYDSNAVQQPSTLVTSTNTVASVDGPVESAVQPLATLMPGVYWIAAIADSDTTIRMNTGPPGYVFSTNPQGWANVPSAFPTGGSMIMAKTPAFFAVLQDN
jgi:hypothetical protein